MTLPGPTGLHPAPRRRPRTALPAALLCGLLLLGGLVLHPAAADDDAPAGAAASGPAPARVQTVDGEAVVTVTPAAQQRSAMRTTVLAAASRRPGTTAYAVAVDPEPLVAAHGKLLSARVEVEAAAAAARASQAEYQRTRALYADDRNASLKALQAAEAAWRTDDAKRRAAEAGLHNEALIARQSFGPVLAAWAEPDRRGGDFAALAARRRTLLRVVLPVMPAGTEAPATVEIAIAGGKRQTARRVSASPQADPTLPGTPWFYQIDGAIPAGTRLLAHVPDGAQASAGVLVPSSAIVWYGGQPWTYVQTAPTRFARRPVAVDMPVGDGYFVPASGRVHAGDRVVTAGAQLLLSQELKPPLGAGCKDAECDD